MSKHKRKRIVPPGVPASPKQLGLRAFHQSDYTTAIKYWSGPELETDSAVRAALAEACFRRGLARRNDLPAFLADLRQAAHLLPGEARFWYQLGLTLHRADQLAEACAAYTRAAGLGLQRPGFGFARALAELERAPQVSLDTMPWLSIEDRTAIEPVAALLRGEPQAILATSPGNWLERLKTLGHTNSSAKLWEGLACLAAGDGARALASLTLSKGQSLRAGAEGVRVFYHGLAAAAVGNSEAALAEWTEAARAATKVGAPLLPRLKEAIAHMHWQRLHSFQAAGLWANVLKHAQAVQTLTPGEPSLLRATLVAANRLANAAAAAGDWATAIAHWQTMRGLLEQTPTLGPLPPVLRNLAIAHEALEQWEAAAELWAALLGTMPRRVSKSKKKTAAPAEAGGIPADEQRAWLRRRVLDNYNRAGRPDQAIAYYKQAVKAAPDDLDLRLELAAALLANEQTIAARNEANRILEKDRQHIGAHLLLAEMHQTRGEWYAAEQALRRALEIDPRREAARRGLAQMLIQRGINSFNNGHYKLAQETYIAALEYAPTDLQALTFLADTELVLKDETAARMRLEAALAAGTVIAYVKVFNCWARHKNEAAARQVLTRAEAAGIASPEFYLGAGVSCLTNAAPPLPNTPWGPPPKPKKADAKWEPWGRELIQKSLANSANQVEALRHIVAALAEAHQYALALEYSRQTIALQPENLESLMSLGSLQTMAGDIAGAKETLRRAAHLARKQGNHQLAKEIEQMRREISNPLFGMLGPMVAQLGPKFLEDLADEELFR
ncbi:MAG: tetratricopeptide repeat protein [Chloroflexi bacterium]|nr:tetratricopeptide repeat protein [Chloroflexota bacterium]